MSKLPIKVEVTELNQTTRMVRLQVLLDDAYLDVTVGDDPIAPLVVVELRDSDNEVLRYLV